MLTTDVSVRELMIQQEQAMTLQRCRYAWHRREYLAARRRARSLRRHGVVCWPGAYDALGQALLKK